MSFNFGNSQFNQLKTHSAYKDGGGMGGGGMYMRQGKKKKDKEEEDIFEYSQDSSENDITLDKEISEKDIPQDTLFNKFVNWFRTKQQ